MFIKCYKYIVTNVKCLNKYDCVFIFDTFFNNLINQINMNTEFNNMTYFYNEYKDNDYIVIPKPIKSTKNILIMEFVEGKKLDDISNSLIEKQKIVMLLNLFIKDNYHFKDFFHSDLHDSNWKVKKYKDFYQLIIYDFGYISKNTLQETFKKLTYYNDILDFNSISEILYDHSLNTKLNKQDFVLSINNYIKNLNIHFREPFCDEIILRLYNYIYINGIKITGNLFELFISILLCKKNVLQYLSIKKIGTTNSNILISSYLTSIQICEKYNIFRELTEFHIETYINNPAVNKTYEFENEYFNKLSINNSVSIDI